MKNLIIPMGGRSSRFPGTNPKWILKHPLSLDPMCVESIKGINFNSFDRIIFTYLKEHEFKYSAQEIIMSSLDNLGIKTKSEIILLDSQTNSQSETVFKTLEMGGVNGFFLVKDSDSFFDCEVESEDNQIFYSDLNETGEIKASSKSYLKIDINGNLTNIVEKKVISPNFCIGGYGFKSPDAFKKAYNKIKDLPGECFVSNVIFQMILDGEKFTGIKGSNFSDWGTLGDWNKFKNNFKTFFIDLDYLYESSADNYESVRNASIDSGTRLVFFTSKKEKDCKELTKELVEKGIVGFQIIYEIPRSSKTLIGSFSDEDSFGLCSSINIHEKDFSLKRYLNK